MKESVEDLETYIACCPCCGTQLQRSEITNSEVRCSKCKEELVVMIENGVVAVMLPGENNEATMKKFTGRVSMYHKLMRSKRK